MKKICNSEITALEDETNYHVKLNDLLADIRLANEDVFNATIEETDSTLIFNFTNGQKFCLSLTEIVSRT